MRQLLLPMLLLVALTEPARAAAYPSGRPHSTDNDDSCDIALLPAATLLLPYFEVDFASNRGSETTVFNVTNVGDTEVVAHVTLWTDYAYPVFDFNIFLTGYDIQSIDLYDVIRNGHIAPFRGTGFEDSGSPQGSFSSDELNPLVDEQTCRNLPMQLPDVYRIRMQQAFTRGEAPPAGRDVPGCTNIGGTHARAVGYATIDVTNRCDIFQPEIPQYYDRLLYDNVLTGEYHQVNRGEQRAQSSPMVHIRAVPEGGTVLSRTIPNLDRTFYSRHLRDGDRRRDARQPLPSVFAARWVSGQGFSTRYRIWREGVDSSFLPTCATYAANRNMDVAEIVRFDDDENVVAVSSDGPPETAPRLAATSSVDVDDDRVFPRSEEDGLSGWIYLNLDRDVDDRIASQAWVVSSMHAGGGLSVDFDVAALGNGCTPPLPYSAASRAGGPAVGPAPNDHAAPLETQSPVRPRSTNNDDSCDIGLLPAATLLLPYYEVSFTPGGKTTLFTVLNVSDRQRVANVTVWTDHRYPLIAFPLTLAPYDTRSIDLYDVLVEGKVETCYGSGTLGEDVRGLVKRIFTTRYPGFRWQCERLSSGGGNATGFVTIDLIDDECLPGFPAEARYFDTIAFDNVLAGDYQYVDVSAGTAAGNPLVHIRAVPEGGDAGTPVPTNLPATFYDRYLPDSRRHADRRQPLPSTFVAPWGDHYRLPGDVKTSWMIWRNGRSTIPRTCYGQHEDDGSHILIPEIVRFDAEENALGETPSAGPCTCPVGGPATRAAGHYDDGEIPDMVTFDDESLGWIYFNLGEHDAAGELYAQAWVSAFQTDGSMTAIRDAVALGNGCSPQAPESEVNDGPGPLGPAPNGEPLMGPMGQMGLMKPHQNDPR